MSASPPAEDHVVDVNTMEDEEDDQDLAAMKARVAEMEAEADKLREMQAGLDGPSGGVDDASAEPEDPAAVDGRSVYVGNVDYGATPEELQQHFLSCGTINRITILCHKPTGHPKGYAYIEFAEPDGAQNAVSALNESTFRQRQLSVVLKRTNVPGMGARGRGRGRGRGGYRGGYRARGGFNPYARGRGSRGRGRGF